MRKKILILATGGTVASMEGESGLTPKLSGDLILEMVPEVNDLCDIDIKQVMNIDSTNMVPDNWITIAKQVLAYYDAYDGFVILHGTDTMAYSAAALSYLIQNSKKPIVLTGSQKPISSSFTDAKLNIYQSVLYAIDKNSCNVTLVFQGKAISGTRVIKQRTRSYNAFESMNFPVIANIIDRRIFRQAISRSVEENKLTTYDSISNRVAVLKLIPGLNPHILESFKEDFDAVVLETFGVGGIPSGTAHSFENAIMDWVKSGRTIIVTTQVPEEGLDLSLYEVGTKYANVEGILEAGDMTTEAIVAKIMWILGQTTDQKRIKEMFYTVINYDRGDF
ncbi:MAG TPA: asparaginase [Candidatus Dorea intestinavium]|nr:asparaginase [Candidatus Dorea intestinavium]